MTLRRRTFLLVTGAVWGVLLAALLTVSTLVEGALHRQLDRALLTHARTEAASSFDRPGGAAHVHDGPVESSSGALTKYAAIYDLHSGALLVHTRSFTAPPPLDPLAQQACRRGEELLVDLQVGARRLRGVWVPAPEPLAPRAVVLLAVPDEGVAQVRGKLRGAAAVTALVGLLAAFAVARLLAQRLLRGTEAIARVARGVAAGDLSERVDLRIPDEEIATLGRNLNDMIVRLDSLLAAQRRFTSDAAHELRSPLTAVRGQLEVALRHPRSADEYRECLESCLEDVLRLTKLAEDLLALARLEGRPIRGQDEVDVRAAAEDTLLRLADSAHAAGVTLALVPGEPAVIVGDALQISRLLRNLVENAVRFAPAGSAVEIEIRPAAGRVHVAVLDRGPGVPRALTDRLFQPFMRADAGRARAQGGTGLGLAIVREIARVHGGDASYADRPGGGAAFGVTVSRA